METAISCERADDLWQAVLAKCEELKRAASPRGGARRSAAMTDADGRGVSAILGIGRLDGTDLVYHVRAREWPRQKTIEVSCDGPWLDSHDHFWEREASRDRANAVVVGHEHYRICPDRPQLGAGSAGFAGFGGALFRIRRLAGGPVIETRNLWHQGTIPPSWRDRLPADAEFIREEAPPFLLGAKTGQED